MKIRIDVKISVSSRGLPIRKQGICVQFRVVGLDPRKVIGGGRKRIRPYLAPEHQQGLPVS